MKPVNVVAPQQSQPQLTTIMMNGEADVSLRELRMCEKFAEKQLREFREKRAEMEKIVEIERKKAMEQEEMRRKREAERRELAIVELAKEQAELAQRRQEMEKEFRQREAEAAQKLQQLQQEAEDLRAVEWSGAWVEKSNNMEEMGKGEQQSTGVGWMGSWLTAPKKWYEHWMSPAKEVEKEATFEDIRPVSNKHHNQICEEEMEQK
ncbi:hypothetical protein PMAYCL1PPCAC_14626, partial [Pristionchus mayeri]